MEIVPSPAVEFETMAVLRQLIRKDYSANRYSRAGFSLVLELAKVTSILEKLNN